MGERSTILKGDVDAAMTLSDHVIEGEFCMGGQEHFYLETQACIVRPSGEDGEIEVFCSSQAPTYLQVHVYQLPHVHARTLTFEVLSNIYSYVLTRYHYFA